jgi:membrane carboxypeptidase/penicillin-binding protein
MERPLGKSETGSKAASPIWLDFMQNVLADKPVREFQVPEEGVIFTQVDARSGLLAGAYTRNVVTECFKEGSEPMRYAAPPPRPPSRSPQIVGKPDRITPNVITSRDDFFKSSM